ncbi:MAG: DUF3035 domain-containing protein [Neomegalonema sp.]|nr:DUF3035 domain-containing protein [Neomegalonema sp.]
MTHSFADRRRPAGRVEARWARRAGALALVALVAGCADFNLRRELGVVGKGPDPFTVVRNKPLEIPTDKAKLPAPKPGARSRVEPTPEADARAALIGSPPGTTAAAPSAAEAGLLKRAGAADASDDVRSKLKKDRSEDDERLLDGVLGSILGDDKPNEEPLDPSKEARRLSEEAKKTSNPGLVIPATKK